MPTFTNSPTYCVTSLNYQLSLTGTFPTWINQNPTTSSKIVIGTTDISTVGTYLFNFNANDANSGITNGSITFTVIMKVMNVSTITIATKPSNQTYLIGSTALLVNLPTYTGYPSKSLVSYTFAVVGAPSFVTLTGTPQKI